VQSFPSFSSLPLPSSPASLHLSPWHSCVHLIITSNKKRLWLMLITLCWPTLVVQMPQHATTGKWTGTVREPGWQGLQEHAFGSWQSGSGHLSTDGAWQIMTHPTLSC
jgi:hypothetical protein